MILALKKTNSKPQNYGLIRKENGNKLILERKYPKGKAKG